MSGRERVKVKHGFGREYDAGIRDRELVGDSQDHLVILGTLKRFAAAKETPTLTLKNLVDPSGKLKIECADSLNAVRVQINHHLVPNVRPFRMMIH